MFDSCTPEILKRMKYLEKKHLDDDIFNIERAKRLRQIPAETGKFIALMLCNSPQGTAVEIGTSGGYSALWLAMACKMVQKKLYTFENDEEKIKIAGATFRQTGLEDIVYLIKGNALHNLKDFSGISFCFIDVDKPLYSDIYQIIITKMVKGGILIADNIISHSGILKEFYTKVIADHRVDAMIIPIGQGVLFCRIK